jgi:hypothetical protein
MSVESAIYVTAVIGLSVCELYMSYELASAVGQPAAFVEAWCRTQLVTAVRLVRGDHLGPGHPGGGRRGCVLVAQLASLMTRLSLAAEMDAAVPAGVRHGLGGGCQWLLAASAAITTGQRSGPVTMTDAELLHAVPANAARSPVQVAGESFPTGPAAPGSGRGSRSPQSRGSRQLRSMVLPGRLPSAGHRRSS